MLAVKLVKKQTTLTLAADFPSRKIRSNACYTLLCGVFIYFLNYLKILEVPSQVQSVSVSLYAVNVESPIKFSFVSEYV